MKPLSISNQFTTIDSPALSKYLNDIARIPMLAEEEEAILAVRIRQGDTAALDKLISSNLRFVVSVAKQYQFKGLNLHDLINEGNMGLVRAANKFDETRGFKFISYAVWWIRQGILQALAEKSRMVRLPLNKIGAINKIKKASFQFEQINQRPPTAEEVSELLDISLNEIRFCLSYQSWHVSLDEPLRLDDQSLRMRDTLPADNSKSPEIELLRSALKSELDVLLDNLSSREIYVIKMYFGIGVNYSLTLDEIGSHLKITKERTRQIKCVALERLRQSSSGRFLHEYLD